MPNYIEQALGRDESVIANAKITGWIWLLPAIVTVVTLGIAFPILLFPYIRITTTELAVTNKRVIAKFGFISRRTIEQRVQKIESVRIIQGIFGRMLGYGTVMIHGTGGATTPIPLVANPLTFKRAVDSVIDDYEESSRDLSPRR